MQSRDALEINSPKTPKVPRPARSSATRDCRFLLPLLLLWLMALTWGLRLSAAIPLSVTTTADSGVGSLRQAILTANTGSGPYLVSFSIPGAGPFVIQPVTPLPSLNSPIQIDATTQPGYAGKPIVRLRGSPSTGNAFEVRATGCLIRGLGIGGFNYGVVLYGNKTRVEACYIGTLDGEAAVANRGFGIVVFSSSNAIGGPTAGQGNLISGNTFSGLDIEGASAVGNTVLGNFIGVNATGSRALANGADGILLYGSSGSKIGGRSVGERNVIGGNRLSGIEVTANSTGNIITGNFVGVDARGEISIGNRGAGVFLSSASQNRIGGGAAGEGNVISGNVLSGVNLNINTSLGGSSADNQILGNRIGTRADGLQAIPNLQAGILVFGAIQGTQIGGVLPGEGNLISGNRLNGIELYGPVTSTRILGNQIGVDVAASTPLPNVSAGILLTTASRNIIGGAESGARNLISGNGLSGIEITANASENRILGNWIGLDATGTNPIQNQEAGVLLSSASGNQVGGANPGEGNVISGNGLNGINLNINPRYGGVTEDNAIQGNRIGVSPDGYQAVGNLQAGILAYGHVSRTLIGGDAEGAGNLISGNKVNGIELDGNIEGTRILGNSIGLALGNLEVIPNDSAGILLSGFGSSVPSNTKVGDATPAGTNWISGNRLSGIEIRGRGTGNQVVGNQIGTTLVSSSQTGNAAHGLFISQEEDLGVPLEGLQISNNVIAYNAYNGVFVDTRKSEAHPESTGISIRHNAIYANGRLGIDLGDDGLQANDATDADTGPNGYQNHPELGEAILNVTGLLTVEGTLQGPANAAYDLDFYLNPSCNPLGSGDGTSWVGTGHVIVGAVSPASFHFALPVPLDLASSSGTVLTATATDVDGNTSEFSPCQLLNVSQGAPRITGQPLDVEQEVGQSAHFQVLAVGKAPLKYQWFVDGQPLAGASDAVLDLPVTLEHDRLLRVVVSNPQGSATSRDAVLRVVPAGGPPDQLSAVPRTDLWLPNGEISALAVENNVLFIGGSFSSLSLPASGASLIDRLDSSQQRPFPRIEGIVRCAAPDGDGGLFVGGQFSRVDGLQRSNLVHLLSDHSVDPTWLASADAEVLGLVVVSNRLHVAGRFTTLNNQRRLALGAVSTLDGRLLPWTLEVHVSGEPVFTPVAHAIQALGGRVFAAGNFGVLSAEGPTPSAPTWQGRLDRGGAVANGSGTALTLGPDTVYLAGEFERVNGVFRTNLVALEARTGAVLDWQADVEGGITGLEYVCDSVVIAGDFVRVNQLPRKRLAVLDPRNATLRPWRTEIDGPITTLSSQFNTLFISGSFHKVGGESRDWMAAIDYTSGATLSWHPEVHQPADSISPLGRSVLLGASVSVPAVARVNFAALDLQSGRPLPLVADCDAPVRTLLATNGTLVLGGGFTTVNGLGRRGLASMDIARGQLRDWKPSVVGTVNALATDGTTLYLGGDFLTVNGTARGNLAAVTVGSGTLLPWNPRITSLDPSPIGVATVNSLAVDASHVYAAGRFDQVGGLAVTDLAVIDSSTGALLPWQPVEQMDPVDKTLSSVRQLLASEGTLWVAGDFLRSPIFGDWRGGLAALDTVSQSLLPWNPSLTWSTDLPFEVRALTLTPEVAYVGGHFGWVYGMPRTHIAAVSSRSPGEVLPWAPEADDTVNVLLNAGRQLVVGGRFKSIGGHVLPFLASFQPKGAPTIQKQPSGGIFEIGSTIHLGAVVTGRPPLSYQWTLNDQPLAGATQSALELSGARIDQSGAYQLLVTNAYGSVSSEAIQIQVIDPVRIVQQPAGGSYDPGTPLVLSVQATGSPSPIYQWRLNGVNIPGADRPTYSIPRGDPTNGGSYSVVVANPGRAISSQIASVIFSSPALPMTDLRTDAGLLPGASGLGSATNEAATRESGESAHAGKYGGKSIWGRWIAPASGVATFSTRGSAFDTLLAIYTNSPAGLSRVADDEDRGGFATSLAAFNAESGKEYWIAVDGFTLASGHVVLSWNLDTNTVPFPRIITQPLSQTASPGQSVSFSATASSLTPLHYQWMRDCVEIPNATNSVLTLDPVTLDDVGVYSVRVRNTSIQAAESDSVLLELSSATDVISQDKLQDLFQEELLAGGGARIRPQGVPVAGWISVPMGLLDGKTVNNVSATTQEREPIHCAVIGGSSKWFRLRGENPGIMALDTIGSSFDTVLAVYTLPNGGALTNVTVLSDLRNLRFIACDDDGAPDHQRSLVRFQAQPGTDYLVAVDGIGAAQGKIQLNWQMGQVPLLSSVPSRSAMQLGGHLTLRAGSTNIGPEPKYQWQLNRVAIAGATNAIWDIGVLLSGYSGTYEVLLSNVFGMTTNLVADIAVSPERLQIEEDARKRTLRFWYPKPAPEPLAFESTVDLRAWTRDRVFTPTDATLIWEETEAPPTNRFFRVIPAASGSGHP